MATNVYQKIGGTSKTQIFAGPQTAAVIAQEVEILADSNSTGETKLVRRGTALVLDNGTYRPLQNTDDTVDAIAACDVSTDGSNVVTSSYFKGEFGDSFIDFGEATLDDVREGARKNGIFFQPVYK